MNIGNERITQVAAFPPAPNWYSTTTASTTDQFYVYASKNLIVVLDLYSFAYRSTFTAALEKINTIDTYSHLCFVSGQDPSIRLWNLLDGSLLATFQSHKAEVTMIKCLREGTIVISGDKAGCVFIQETSGMKNQQITPVKSEVTAMALVNHENVDYIAIGYLNGMIMVYSIGDNLQLQEHNQLLHTNDGVNSLSWQIIHTQQEKQTTWPSLASSGKRTKDVLIWQVSESTVCCTIKLPKPESHWTAQQKNSNWIHLAWSPTRSTEICITSHIGQILRYDISGSKISQLTPRFEQGHSRIAFTLCHAGAYHIITSSLDGQVIKWNLRNGKVAVNIKTQVGFPYSLDISSNNPDQVAIGYGDSVIKVWKYNQIGKRTKPGQQQQGNFYESTSFWKGIRGQVEKVQWHPTTEGIMAYGTEYGHVGIYDFYNSKCQTLKEYHMAGGGTPSMTWTGDLSSLLADHGVAGHGTMTDTLITCGGKNGDLFIRNASHPHQAPISLAGILQTINPSFYTLLETKQSRCVFVSANPSGLFLALGNSDGSLEIYSLKNLKVIYASNYHRKKITSLHWKDLGDYSLLASGCDNGEIGAHKINHDIDISPTASLIIETSPFGILKAHKKSITDLKWSHHSNQILLASTSFDNLAIIWNMEPTPSVISSFQNHRGCVYSVCWQYLDPDILLTGGDDRFIYMWNWKDFKMNVDSLDKFVPVFIREKRRMTKRKPIKTEVVGNSKKQGLGATDDEATTSNIDSAAKKRKTTNYTKSSNKTKTLFNATTTTIATIDQIQLQQQCFVLAITLCAEDDADVFSMSLISAIKNRCDKADDDAHISKYTTISPAHSGKESTKTHYLKLITGDKNDIRDLIGVEVDQLNDNDMTANETTTISTTATFMGSDVKLALDIMRSNLFTLGSYAHAGDGMMLTDWIVLALSPMAGKETWLNMMEEQARKLASSGLHHLAATCFIACSKIYEAINVYRQASMFTEAIAMLKIRLPEDDPLLATLLTEWAQQLQAKGQEELAALCYIQSRLPGCITNAANLLGRRGTESSSFWSACLMALLNNVPTEMYIERWLGMVNKRKAEPPSTKNLIEESTG